MSQSNFAYSSRPLAVDGIRLATRNVGIKQTKRDDICLMEIAENAAVAAVFTQNRFAAAPVKVAQNHLTTTLNPRYLIINSGNANAGTGIMGIEDTEKYCDALGELSGTERTQILPFSTGVIGERLPIGKMVGSLPDLVARLSSDAWDDAAQAIMTTDTKPKSVSFQLSIAGEMITVTGIAKGSGMIKPNMATMLSFIATDATVDEADLQSLLTTATDKSFNRITVDGDTSTNDACVLIATGAKAAQRPLNRGCEDWAQFCDAVEAVATGLAKSIISDGEGATKFVEIRVLSDSEEASSGIAFTIAESPLVKTALFASDPNWGRILAAIGRAEVETFDIDQVDIYLDDYKIVEKGGVIPDYNEATAAAVMTKPDITIDVRVGDGNCLATVWTCDLSYDYVKINAEYRT